MNFKDISRRFKMFFSLKHIGQHFVFQPRFWRQFSISNYDEELDVFRDNQHYFYLFLIVFIILFLYQFLLQPTIDHYDRLLHLYDQVQQRFINTSKMIKKEEKFEKTEIEQLSEQVNAYQDKFFTEEQFYEFYIHLLPYIVEDFDNKLTRIGYSTSGLIDDEYFEYRLQLSLQGSFKNIMAFLAYVESYDRFLRIKSFNFSPRASRFQTDLSVGLVLIGYGVQK